MALNIFQRNRFEDEVSRFIEERRPPADIRDELDLGFKIENQSLILFEIRPRWNNPKEKMECPYAKATYLKTRDVWKVYWQRADLKWHGYDPVPEVALLGDFLRLVEEDEYDCFC